MDIKVQIIRFEMKKKTSVVFLVPFIPSQPMETLKSGNMYLKSIDKNHRRYYEKFVDDNKEKDDKKYIQQRYVRNNYRFFMLLLTLFNF